jgi:hypothetical protein
LHSGTYNGAFTPTGHNHAGVIDPPGSNIVFYRFIGQDTGGAYYEFVNLFGGYASNLVVRGGPFPADGPFAVTGTADFLNGAFPGVPVMVSGTSANGVIDLAVQIGGAGLPFGMSSTWRVVANRAGELPAAPPAPAPVGAPIISTQVQFKQIINEIEGNCGGGPGVGSDLSPQTPTPITIDWQNHLITIDDSLPSAFDPVSGFSSVVWADGRRSDVTITRNGLTGSSGFSPFPGCMVGFDTSATVVPGQPSLYP